MSAEQAERTAANTLELVQARRTLAALRTLGNELASDSDPHICEVGTDVLAILDNPPPAPKAAP